MEKQAATLMTLSSSRTAVVAAEEEEEEASSKEEEVEEVEEATLTTSVVVVVEEEVEEGLIITEEVEASTTNAGVITKVIKAVVSMINRVVLTTTGEVTGASRTTVATPGEEVATTKAITRGTKAVTKVVIKAVTKATTRAVTRVATREITKEEATMMIKLITRQDKEVKLRRRLIRVTEEDRAEDTTLTRVAINRTSALRTRVTTRVVVRIKLLQEASMRIIRAIRIKEVIRTTAEEEVAEVDVATSREVEDVVVEQELLQDLHPQRTRVRTLTKTTMSSLRPFLRAHRLATRQRITVDMPRLRVPTIRRLDIRLIKDY